jgi:peptidoglycan/xylan/chitin deacetylase (PgdA/CDA1 family)
MWRSGTRSKPPLAVTFDDGQLDNFLHARPVLAALGVRATFFATVRGAESGELLWHDRMAYSVLRMLDSRGSDLQELWDSFGQPLATRLLSGGSSHDSAARAVESAKHWSTSKRHEWLEKAKAILGNVAPDWDGMMSASELRALGDEGHEVGCHSRSHEILPDLDDATLRDEIVESKRSLDALTGHPCVSFCYPNGDFDSRCDRLVREHYEYGVTTKWGTNPRSTDRSLLRRIDIVADNMRSRCENLSVPLLAWRMSSLYSGPRL